MDINRCYDIIFIYTSTKVLDLIIENGNFE